MDSSEQIAQKFLHARGHQSVVFEPDGNIPPDFLVDGRFAVEVRRLNQNFISSDGRYKSLEEERIPLQAKIRHLLTSFGPALDAESWFVFADFRRPLQPWSELRPAMFDVLSAFRRQSEREPATVQIAPRFKLEFLRASKPFSTFFVPGGCDDRNAGGWVLSYMLINTELCVAEKGRKIAQYHPRYNEWWLVLIDHIGYGLIPSDQAHFRELAPRVGRWGKIFFVDPMNHERGFQL